MSAALVAASVRVTELVVVYVAPAAILILPAVGLAVSMTIALLAPSEPEAPGEGSVIVALFEAKSRAAPEFKLRALVLT
jgi:hypothetical protein